MSYLLQWTMPMLLKLLPYGLFILAVNFSLDHWQAVHQTSKTYLNNFGPALLSLFKYVVCLAMMPCFIYAALKVALRTWVMVKRLFLYENSTFHITNKYGPAKKTWAIVTGATDGIGWGFCENLARQKYNIILISRNLEKLKSRGKQLETKYNVGVHLIQADFSECYANPIFFEEIYKALDTKNLDIGILVNNVGQLVLNMENSGSDDVMKMAGLNTVAQFGMTKILIKDLSSRLHKSAIIDVSSIAAMTRRKEIPLYSASKRFNQFLTEVGSEQSDTSLDFISVRPAWVCTPMTSHRNQDLYTCMPDDTVQGVFRALGRDLVVFGSRKHEFLAWMLETGTLFFGSDLTRAFVYGFILVVWNWVMNVKQEDFYTRPMNDNNKK